MGKTTLDLGEQEKKAFNPGFETRIESEQGPYERIRIAGHVCREGVGKPPRVPVGRSHLAVRPVETDQFSTKPPAWRCADPETVV